MGLKIIGAGFGRTGTTSLKSALEEVGFNKCYHMVEVVKRPTHGVLWHKAWLGEAPNWEALFSGFQASVDWPGAAFYKQLIAEYPDAKVILTVRDPEKWYGSTAATIFNVRSVIPKWLTRLFPPMRRMPDMVESVIWQGIFDGRFADKPYAVEVFKRHNEAVKEHVPPEKLLVFNVKEGWEPLCRFLEVPIPDRPFPHLNDRKMFERMVFFRKLLPYGLSLIILLLLVGGWTLIF